MKFQAWTDSQEAHLYLIFTWFLHTFTHRHPSVSPKLTQEERIWTCWRVKESHKGGTELSTWKNRTEILFSHQIAFSSSTSPNEGGKSISLPITALKLFNIRIKVLQVFLWLVYLHVYGMVWTFLFEERKRK